MNRQMVYEKVRNHLLAQGKKARPEGSAGCYYHTREGLKCAVGCLIPDQFYSPGLEACVIDTDVPTKPNAKILRAILAATIPDFDPDPRGSDVQFLRNLQSIHDGNEPSEWPRLLDTFADQNGLER